MSDDVDLGQVYYVVAQPKQDPARVVAGPLEDPDGAHRRASFDACPNTRVMLGVYLVANILEFDYNVEWDGADRPEALVATDGGHPMRDTEQPPVESFDPWKLEQPDDGIVYLYRSSVDGFWRVINDEDIALEEATGYPVGELVDQEAMGDYEDSESGQLRAIYVPPADLDDSEQRDCGVAPIGGLVCQNFEAHPGEEVEMQSGPYEGVICPECGRAAGGGSPLDIPYIDEVSR